MNVTEEQAHELCKIVESTFKVIGDKYHINSGGCGMFAKHLSEQLRRLNVKHELYMVGHGDNILYTLPKVKRLVSGDFYMMHIFVGLQTKEGKTVFIDSDGELGRTTADAKITLPCLNEYLNYPHSWNRMFDRGNMPVIEKGIIAAVDYWGLSCLKRLKI